VYNIFSSFSQRGLSMIILQIHDI